jgi:predicted AlkP superfamily pyrophosphatase or phosphodiesterase
VRKVVVIDIPGLTPALVGEETPHLAALARAGFSAPLGTVFPAVTCPVQSTFLTGLAPAEHGVVGNGWYWPDLGEVLFWRQPDRLVGGDRLWDEGRRRNDAFTCARLFWWFNMYSSVDVAVTPRPVYGAAGAKLPDIWTRPGDLREKLQEKFGDFPLFEFWGPRAGIGSTRWIVNATQFVLEELQPTLLLTYLPHLDYDFQRHGPDHPRSRRALGELDAEAGRLIAYARAQGCQVVVISEYGIQPVSGAVFLNRVLREAGCIKVRETRFGEILEPAGSRAFAVTDHQAAHVHLQDPAEGRRLGAMLAELPGVERVLDRKAQAGLGIDHARAGDLVLVAEEGRWFAYPYWLDDDLAPDFAATVDIHRKPGYDPGELFLDPAILLPRLKIAWKVLLKKLGFATLMDFVPLDPSLVGGSHGRLPARPEEGPVLLCSEEEAAVESLAATDFRSWLLDLVLGAGGKEGNSP